jgi:hypothetical protein
LLAEWYLRSGRWLAVVLLALAWGAQLTLGHFQIQWWTAALVVLVGLWRAALEGRSWLRVLAVLIALGWGAAMASVQLLASWELARFVGFTHRSFAELVFYGFPAAHWPELALPTLFRGATGGPEAGYWYSQGTTGYEACLYVGTVPLMLAFLGLTRGRIRAVAPWIFVVAASLTLAMLPGLWPGAYEVVTRVPGFGWFRAPGRYTVLASLGLCLLAARGLDRSSPPRACRLGLVLAWVFALAAAGWGIFWSLRADHAPALGGSRLAICLAGSALTWVLATGLIIAWRCRRVGAWVLLVASTIELACLYYTSTTVWGWAVELPGDSRVLARLAAEPEVGRVAGLVHNLPVRSGAAPVYPFTGFAMPPPHPALEFATRRTEALSSGGLARLRRFGVTHGIWDGPVPARDAAVVLETEDPILDRLVFKPPGAPARATWRLVRYPTPLPEARAAIRVHLAPQESSLISGISFDPDPQSVWYRAGEEPQTSPQPRARSARVVSWDGRTAVVEHDGPCDLVMNRTFYPGWFTSVDDGPEQQVRRAELGIQSVPLAGTGTSKVRFTYRLAGMKTASALSLAAVGLAVLGVALEAVRGVRGRVSRLPSRSI